MTFPAYAAATAVARSAALNASQAKAGPVERVLIAPRALNALRSFQLADGLEAGGAVIGKLPEDLNGLYVRNGPNAFYAPDWRYHAYDGEDRGTPKLRIEPIKWDRQGWPTVASAEAK